jgi:hypothetical protein
MAVTFSWNLHTSTSGYNVTEADVPYLDLTLTSPTDKVISVTFKGSEIFGLDIFLADAYADVYYDDGTIDLRQHIVNDLGLQIYAVAFTADNDADFLNHAAWTELSTGTPLTKLRIDDVITLNPKFEAQSSLIGIRMTTPGISNYQIRNWKLIMEFQTKMPDLATVTNPLPY